MLLAVSFKVFSLRPEIRTVAPSATNLVAMAAPVCLLEYIVQESLLGYMIPPFMYCFNDIMVYFLVLL